jgi:hypothetical protein
MRRQLILMLALVIALTGTAFANGDWIRLPQSPHRVARGSSLTLDVWASREMKFTFYGNCLQYKDFDFRQWYWKREDGSVHYVYFFSTRGMAGGISCKLEATGYGNARASMTIQTT